MKEFNLEKLRATHLVLILWVFLTLFNINKAYHIDDAFHLEAAEHIIKKPGRPMSGFINWNDTQHQISTYNQPPLFFYLIALVGYLFGFSEIPMHIMLSVFTFLCLLYFSKIAQHIKVKQHNLLLVVFVLCPALLINQNLMVDVPMLACLLGATYYLFLGLNNSKKLINSMLWFSAGLLIKYSILPFGLLFGLILLVRLKLKELVYGLIPITVLALWAMWNYIEFGSSHFLDRPSHQLNFGLFFSFTSCLGAIATFAPLLLGGIRKNKYYQLVVALIWTVLIVSLILSYFNPQLQNHINLNITNYTISIGFAVFLSILISTVSYLKKWSVSFFQTNEFVLLLFTVILSLSMILLPIFMASRHILLVIPFLLLYSEPLLNRAKTPLLIIYLSFSFVITCFLGFADWRFANSYRTVIPKVMEKVQGTTWSRGHWGWQWYSKKAGMKFYDSHNETAVQKGDYLVYATQLPKQPVSSRIEYVGVDSIYLESGFIDFFSARNGRFYNSNLIRTFWYLSKQPLDTIVIAKVTKEISVNNIMEVIYASPEWLKNIENDAVKQGVSLDSSVYLNALYVKNESIRKAK